MPSWCADAGGIRIHFSHGGHIGSFVISEPDFTRSLVSGPRHDSFTRVKDGFVPRGVWPGEQDKPIAIPRC